MKVKSLERSPSLPEEIVASLTGALHKGELRPGDRLPSETALANEFGVARTVVREAISQLKYDGVVQSRVGVGAFIAQPQERTAFRISPACFQKRRELLKLLRLRNGVVIEVAADAAVARSNRDIVRMEAILKQMREAISDRERGAERHFEAERQLIHTIAKVADNEHALNFIMLIDGQIAEKLRSVAVKNTKATELATVAIEEQARLVEAIKRGDPAAARDKAREHYDNAAQRLADRADLADV
ncbi:FadR/GntR family transcriptional regulator [Bradyrhizobium jicamae]|uniref:FadR/GntR family transcriptional regulator n=1 Tax=Bradyrhizobium jicamae TaxID=280332 RepID=UPI0018DDFE3F|nr:GntR family transcriptional regulator [Bradyrhizobium jicamae]